MDGNWSCTTLMNIMHAWATGGCTRTHINMHACINLRDGHWKKIQMNIVLPITLNLIFYSFSHVHPVVVIKIIIIVKLNAIITTVTLLFHHS